MKKLFTLLSFILVFGLGAQKVNADPVPSITILSPMDSKTIRLGDKITVKWSSVGVPSDETVVIGLNTNTTTGSAGFGAQAYAKNTGSASFYLLNDLPSQFLNNKFDISVTSLNGVAGKNSSSKKFKVTPCAKKCTGPEIEVISPTSRDTFKPGDTVKVKWNTRNIPSDAEVIIGISTVDSNGGTINNTPVVNYRLKTKNTGSATFTLPARKLFGVALNPKSKSFTNKYQFSVYYPIMDSTHIPMGNSTPIPIKNNVFTNTTKDTPFTDSFYAVSSKFTIK
ncbi:MAG: hypothetical protein QG566_75 [Patescibacteria group bacterium]|nr:hypothetical protein [Patescibacteria group bacterium]